MGYIFRYDNFLNQTLVKVADCMLLSLLWLITSLPVGTVFASTTALYYAINKCVRQPGGSVLAAYWKSFQTNLKQATILGLMLLPVYVLLATSCYGAYVMYMVGKVSKVLLIFLACIAMVFFMWSSYIFPYLARFNDGNKRILKNCTLIALYNILWSGALAVVGVAGVILVLIYPIGVFLIPGASMLIKSYILEHVLKPYIPPENSAVNE